MRALRLGWQRHAWHALGCGMLGQAEGLGAGGWGLSQYRDLICSAWATARFSSLLRLHALVYSRITYPSALDQGAKQSLKTNMAHGKERPRGAVIT